MHSLDWNDVRYFLAVCQAGTLAGAGRSLGVQHSTVARRLAAIEQALGVSLFTRTPDGMVLTEAGSEVLPLAREAGRALAAVELKVAGGDKRIDGTVRVTTSEGFSNFLIGVLSELKARYPELTVDIISVSRPLDLTRGEADIAVRLISTPQPDLIVRKIGACGWSLYAAASYLDRAGAPAGPEKLAGHDLIGFDDAMTGSPGAVWIRQHGEGTNIVLRGASTVTILNAAMVGMGVAMLPCFLAAAETGLRRLTPAVLASQDIWLVYQSAVGRIARVRAVIDFIIEAVARESARLRGDEAA
jgi:DNA-binding transcriptional LysR family regulator